MFPKITAASSEETITSVLDGVMKAYCDNIAVDYQREERITYGQLDQHVCALSGTLASHVKPKDRVVVLLPRSIAQIVCITTIFSMGAIYIPFDVEIAHGRLDALLRRIKPAVLLTLNEMKSQLLARGHTELIYVDPESALEGPLVEHPCSKHSHRPSPHDVAVVLFTSGSTGEPKGVQLSHRNLLEPLRYISVSQQIVPAARILQFSSVAFDVHLLDILSAMLNAGTVCQVSKDNLLSRLVFWIDRMETPWVHLTPSVWSLLNPTDLPALKHMLCSGEPMTRQIVEQWSPNVILTNLYGPCEASSSLASQLRPSDDPSVLQPVTSAARIVLLDDDGSVITSSGSIGELHCWGNSIFEGYLDDPVTTATKFTKCGANGQVVFATGDLGSWTPDGSIQLLGRVDSQVKVNGQRVELSEIDHVLGTICARVVTRSRKDANGQTRLFSFVTTNESFSGPLDPCSISEGDEEWLQPLRAVCHSKLATYMIPQLISITAIPMNSSGKTDFRRLETLLDNRVRVAVSAHGEGLRALGFDNLEENLVAALQRREPRPVSSPDNHLLALGLSSLDAMVLVRDIEATFSVRVTFKQIMQDPSIRTLARDIQRMQQQQQQQHLPNSTDNARIVAEPYAPISIDGEHPRLAISSPAQDRIYAAQRISSNGAYNCNWAFEFTDQIVDVDALRKALHTVCRSHETLRSTFIPFDDSLEDLRPSFARANPLCIQKIHQIESLPPKFESVSKSSILALQPADTRRVSLKDVAVSLIKENSKILFDIEAASPVRATVYELGESHFIFHISIHHISIDDWSFSLLVNQLQDAYRSVHPHDEQALPSAIQYQEYVTWSRSATQREEHQTSLDWWSRQINEEYVSLRPVDLSPLIPSEAVRNDLKEQSAIYRHELNSEHAEMFLNQYATNTTPFVCWFGLVQALLARMSRKEKFIIGVPVTDRWINTRFQDIVGFCLNTIAFPVAVDLNANFSELTTTIASLFQECNAHPAPFEDVLEKLAQGSMERRETLALSTMFMYHEPAYNQTHVDRSKLMYRASNIKLDTPSTEFPLVFHVESGPNPYVSIQYRTNKFAPAFVEGMAYALDALLKDVTSEPLATSLRDLNVVPPHHQALLDRWSSFRPLSQTMRNTSLEYKGFNVVERFDYIAKTFPETTAIETVDGEKMTYHELRHKSENLASHLEKHGSVRGEVCVVAMDKSTELVISILAILRTGAAFLLIDTSHSMARNMSKIKLSSAKMILIRDDNEFVPDEALAPQRLLLIHVRKMYFESLHCDSSRNAIEPIDPAYLCFSSGSTGNPKCFSIPHHALSACIVGLIETFEIGPGTRAAFICNVTFDIAVSHVFSTLLSGATLCVASSNAFATSLGSTLNAMSVDYLEITTTQLSTLSGPREVPSLRHINVVGEAPSVQIFDIWSPRVALYNTYGPAEATITTNVHRMEVCNDRATVTKNIGRPLPAVRSFVLDDAQKPVLPGVVGFHYLGERVPGLIGQLSLGYISPTDANKRFSDHTSHGRIFNTGDLAYFDYDGNLFITGREDDQVKLNGIRFELGDVERTLDSILPHGCKVTAVICKSHIPDRPVLVAFVYDQAWSDGALPDTWLRNVRPEDQQRLRTLRSEGEKAMHPVMVPHFWIPVSRFPRGPTGKTDRNFLKAWFTKAQNEDPQKMRLHTTLHDNFHLAALSKPAMVPPQFGDARSKEIIDCWQTVLMLGSEATDFVTPFFHAGGDSILAIRLCARLRSRAVAGCSVEQLFRNPSLHQLLETLSNTGVTSIEERSMDHRNIQASIISSCKEVARMMPAIDQELERLDIDKSSVSCIYPVSALQQSMIMLSQESKQMYKQQVSWNFRGSIDPERVLSAWRRLVLAHAALRTTFLSFTTDAGLKVFAVELTKLPMTVETALVRVVPAEPLFSEYLAHDQTLPFSFGGLMHRVALFQGSGCDHSPRILVTFHHALNDGWSLDVLLHDFIQAYRGQDLPPRIPASRYVAYDLERDKHSAKKHWQAVLTRSESTTLGWRRPAPGCANPGVLRKHLDKLDEEMVSKAAQSFGVTSAVLFQTALALLLSKITGKSEVLFAMTVSGRNAPVTGLEKMVGLVMNSIPMTVPINAADVLPQVLNRVAAQAAAGAAHDHVSLLDIASDLIDQVPDTFLVYENHISSEYQQLDQDLLLIDVDGHEFTEVPLMIIIEHKSVGTDITFKWEQSCATAAEIQSWLSQYSLILEDMIYTGCDTTSVKSIGNSAPYPELEAVQSALCHQKEQSERLGKETLVSMFRDTALKYPTHIALETPTTKISFAYLDQASDRLATLLVDLGVQAEDVVPIIFSRTPYMIMAMLAIMKANGSYCPIDAKAPPGRKIVILEKIQARFVLGSAEHLKPIAEYKDGRFRLLSIDDLLLQLFGWSDTVLPHIQPQDLCYVIFTSGSTGQPKGCKLSHGAVANVIRETLPIYEMGPESRVLLFANYIFDASVIDIYGTLSAGATLFLAGEDEVMGDLNRVIMQHHITAIHLTPSVIGLLDPGCCASLKLLISGGEKLSSSIRDTWADRVKLVDSFGPTECAVQVAATHVLPSSPTSVIYDPIKGNFLAVLDFYGNVARIGQVGELHVGGVQTFEGYIGEAQLTEDAFCLSALDPQCRFYCTGDLAVYNVDMSIRLMGRKDNQIKHMGQRIELEEIENVLNALPGVLRSVVFVYQNSLTAVLQPEHDPTRQLFADGIMTDCFRQLPTALMPQRVVFSNIPLLPSGKVDRREETLLPIVQGDLELRPPKQSPNTTEEEFVAQAVAQLVGRSDIDIDMPFSYIGLHSLNLMHLKAVVTKRFQISLSLSQLLEAGTVRDLSALFSVVSKDAEQTSVDMVAGLPQKAKALPAQLHMWMAQERLQDDTYNVVSVLELPQVEASRLFEATRKLLDNMDIFRTSFAWDHLEETLYQQLNDDSRAEPILKDFSGLIDPVKIIRREAEQESKFIFQLESGPLAHVVIYDCGKAGCFLFYNIHHILVDELTCQKMLGTLHQLYENPDHEQKNRSFLETSLCWESIMDEETVQMTVLRSVTNLSGLQPVSLSAWPKPGGQHNMGSSESIYDVLVDSQAQCLSRLATSMGLSTFCVSLSIFLVILHRYTAANDIAILIPITTRVIDPGLVDHIGNFTNTAIIRSCLDETVTTAQLFRETAHNVNFALEHCVAPLEDIISQLGVGQSALNIMFSYNESLSKPFVNVRDHTSEILIDQPAMFDLCFTVENLCGSFITRLQYDAGKFERKFMRMLSDSFRFLVDNIESHLKSNLWQFPFCDDSHMEVIRTASHAQVFDFTIPPDLLHELFENQASKAPETAAINYLQGETTHVITYEELDQRGRSIASTLQQRYNVGPGDIVPIRVDQGPDLVAAILAVLKCGCTFTPFGIGDTWSHERLQHAVSLCNPKVIIVDEANASRLEPPILNLSRDRLHDGDTMVSRYPTKDDIAYVLWTSGTTGTPKGVKIKHSAAVTNFCTISIELYGGNSHDRVLQFASPMFDVYLDDIFGGFARGATMCMAPRQDLLDNIERVIEVLKPTTADLTPAVISLLDPSKANLRVLVSGGEAFSANIQKEWASTKTEVYNAYGPCEVTINSTFTRVMPSSDISSIGKPIRSVKAVILDARGNLNPPYVRGEIFLGGPQLFSGYLGDDTLAQAKMRDHQSFGLLYASGDVAFYDFTGDIILCGREDDQVKIRGQRIELSEVVSAIERGSDVERAIVMKYQDQLVASVVRTRGAGLESRNIAEKLTLSRMLDSSVIHAMKKSLSTQLPARSIPSLWVELNYIPFTASGKVDKARLLQLLHELATVPEVDCVLPEDDFERILEKCCCQALRVEAVGMTHNLFDLGMDSFLAMAFVSQVRKALPELSMTIRDVAETLTLKSLATLLRLDGRGKSEWPVQVTLPEQSCCHRSDVRRFPASSIQKRFYMSQIVFDDATYSISQLYQVLAKTTLQKIRAAFEAIVTQNPIFRTSFDLTDQLWQTIHEPDEFQYQEFRFETMDEAEAYGKLQEITQTDSDLTFNLGEPYPIRCKSFSMPDSKTFIYLNVHHIIIDEVSTEMLLDELLSSAPGSVGAMKREFSHAQYLDFAVEESLLLEDAEKCATAYDFWKGYLHNVNPSTLIKSIPQLDQPGDHGFGQFSFSLPYASLVWPRGYGITVFSSLLTMLQISVCRLWAREECSVLIPIAQRPMEGPKPLYGCFINTVPIKASVQPCKSFEHILMQQNQQLLNVMRNSFLPFERILGCGRFKHEDFQIMFVHHDLDRADRAKRYIKTNILPEDLHRKTKPKFPLTFTAATERKGAHVLFNISLDYRRSRLEDSSASALADEFKHVLELAGKNPSSFAIEQNGTTQRSEVSRPVVKTPKNDTPIAHLIEKSARRFATHTALVMEGTETMIYRDFWLRVESVAAGLAPYANSPDLKVGICMDAGFSRIIAIVAVTYCGMAYVPLDAQLPPARLASIVEDCQPSLILVQAAQNAAHQDAIATLRSAIDVRVPIMSIETLIPTSSVDPVIHREIGCSDLAYILYTSGSTGKPKGVQITCGALANSIQEHVKLYRLDQSSRLLQFAPWTFDVSVVDIFGTLSVGGTLCLGRKDWLLSNLDSAFETMQITHIATTPTVIGLVSPWKAPSLKVLAIGGEPMTEKVRDLWSRKAELLNVYGPTEATVNVISCVVTSTSSPAVIGKPLPGNDIFILGQDFEKVPFGSIGELCISGLQLARGYLNCPEENKAFMDHAKFGRLYMTGDLAKLTSEGSIVCLGRKDNQVKLRGQRIELGEIERVAETHPSVQTAVAFVTNARGHDFVVLAFCLVHSVLPVVGEESWLSSLDDVTQPLHEIRNVVVGALPQYFVPTYWVPLLTMPQNTNGKIDRRAVKILVDSFEEVQLARYLYVEDDQDGNDSSLESEAERVVAKCMSEVLSINRITSADNFFSLSGDSISAIRLNSLLRASGYVVTVQDIYKHPTVSRLSKVIKFGKTSPDVVPHFVSAVGNVHPTPIFDWFLASRMENPSWYNQSRVLRLNTMDDLDKIPEAWSVLLSVHPMLRIRITHMPKINKSITATDFLVTRSEVRSEEEFLNMTSDLQSSLNLREGHVSALGLFRYNDKPICVIVAHHAIVDVVSWQIILDDLKTLLRKEDIAPEISPFRAWSEYTKAKQAFTGLEPSRVGTQAALSTTNTISSLGRVTLHMDKHRTHGLLTSANSAFNTEPVELLLSGLVRAMAGWGDMGEIDLVFESHGRSFDSLDYDFSRTVGWFTYLYNIHFHIHSEDGLDDLVAQTKDTRRQASTGLDFAKKFDDRIQQAAFTFNYAGSYSNSQSDDLFQVLDGSSVIAQNEAPTNIRSSVFDFGCEIVDGVLNLNITFSNMLHTPHDVSRLAQAWLNSMELIHDFCAEQTSTVLTACDLAFISVSTNQAKELSKRCLRPYNIEPSSVEAILPATDIQTAMALASQEYGSYQETYVYMIKGPCDVSRLKDAWKGVISKHSALRTVFVPCEAGINTVGSDLLQIVLKSADFGEVFIVNESSRQSLAFEYGRPLMTLSFAKLGPEATRVTWLCHHAIADGWSMGVILHDLYQAYNGTLDEQVLQYYQISNDIRSSETEQAEEFWKEELHRFPPCVLIDHSNTSSLQQDSDLKVIQSLHCPTELAQSYAALHGTTVSVLLRAAWALALSFHVGEEKVTFGVTSSGRHHSIEGIENVVGPCVTTTPFAVDIVPDMELDEFVTAIKEKDFSLMPHQSLSLRRIFRAANVTGLFNTVLVYQNYPSFDDSTPGPFQMELEHFEESTDIPLNLLVGSDTSGELSVTAMIHGNVFSLAFVEGILSSFSLALEAICGTTTTTNIKIRDLELLSTSSKTTLSGYSDGGPCPWTATQLTMWCLFRTQALEAPDRTAITFLSPTGDQSWSYSDLLNHAVSMSDILRRAGVQRGQVVAIHLERSLETVAIVLAVLSLGAAYMPIELGTPIDRISFMLQEADATLTVTTVTESHLFWSIGVRSLCIQDILLLLPRVSLRNLDLITCQGDPAGPDELAAILFTSGTTGVPKGVLMPNRLLAGYALNMNDAYHYCQNSVVFNFARYVFDVWITDIFGSLACGAKVCLASAHDTMNDLVTLLQRCQATNVNLTPSVAAMLDPSDLPDLKTIVLTGEPSTRQLLQTWAPKVLVINSYGPTEAGVITQNESFSTSDPRSVGRPVKGMNVTILDDQLRQVPVGVTGTIYASGVQLSLGYCGRPDLTAESFIFNPIDGKTRMYCTGDIGAFDSAGRVLCFARRDKQIKLRGQRIELGEIENVVRRLDHTVVVALIKDSHGSQHLVAFFTSQYGDGSTNIDGHARLLQAEARRLLPRYMVPSAFVHVTKIPLTPNGKLDNPSLCREYEQHLSVPIQSSHMKVLIRFPLTKTESLLRDRIETMFGVGNIAVDADLTSAILDSLATMRLAGGLRRLLNIPVTLQWIMENRSIEDLARKIDAHTAQWPTPASSAAWTPIFSIDPVIQFSSPGSASKRVFCIHPSSGLAFEFRNLVKYLPGIEVVGLNDPSYGNEDAFPDIPTMARSYLSLVTGIQSGGPYYIIGYSFGGHVALEVARLLRASDLDVTLILVDSCSYPRGFETITTPLLDAVIDNFKIAAATEDMPHEERDWRSKLRSEVKRNLLLMSRYRPERYNGQIIFLRAYDSPVQESTCAEDRSNGYDRIVDQDQLTIIPIYGDHYEVFTGKVFMDHNGGVFAKILLDT